MQNNNEVKNKQADTQNTFGVSGDYMTAGIEELNGEINNANEPKSPQGLPGRENPPKPRDDKKEAGMSMAERLKERIQKMFS